MAWLASTGMLLTATYSRWAESYYNTFRRDLSRMDPALRQASRGQ